MFLALMAMRRLHPERKAVVLPAWCCPSVAQAVIQAGLRPVLADLDAGSLAYSEESLAGSVTPDTLAVLLVHFFGLPVPAPALPQPPPFFLRDCAQDFLFRRDRDHDLPTFYSFGRGKSLNGGHGGALCLPPGSPLLAPGREILEGFPPASNPLPKLLLINWLSHPLAFGALSRLSFLRIGETRWESPLAFTRMHPDFHRLAGPLLDALEENLPAYGALIGEYAGLAAASQGSASVPGPGYAAGKAPIRFPLLISDPALRARFMDGMNAAFGGVTGQYPELLPKLPGAPALDPGGPYAGSERIAKRIVTLPVTSWLRQDRGAFLALARKLLSGAHG